MKLFTGKLGITITMLFSIITGIVALIVSGSVVKSVIAVIGTAFIMGSIQWIADDRYNDEKKQEQEKEKLKSELSQWRQIENSLEWNDGLTAFQRLIKQFGKERVERMLIYDLLNEKEMEGNEHS